MLSSDCIGGIVAHLREALGGDAADALRRAVGGDQLRLLGFERHELLDQAVELAIGDLGPAEPVVEILVAADLPSQLLRPARGIDLASGCHGPKFMPPGCRSQFRS